MKYLAAMLTVLAFATACSDKPGSSAALPTAGDSGTLPNSVEQPTTRLPKPDASVARDPPNDYGVRDRAGRPLVFQLLASASNRDYYNTSGAPDPLFSDEGAQGAPVIGAEFQSALVSIDMLDGHDDWNGGAADAGPDPEAGVYPHPLTDAWLTDVIVVDPDKPFSKSGYLDVEAHPGENLTCGGRWFSDDAIDKTLSYLVNGTTSGVSDGVAAATKAPTLTFPYLAPPN